MLFLLFVPDYVYVTYDQYLFPCLIEIPLTCICYSHLFSYPDNLLTAIIWFLF